MASYHLSVKTVQRSAGRSAVEQAEPEAGGSAPAQEARSIRERL